ncbi:glycoside hydrolase family 43 protein [Atractiella rhizophila]|nr:glycoside hydrolase family 43 protein [Atractiella rhizophila]
MFTPIFNFIVASTTLLRLASAITSRPLNGAISTPADTGSPTLCKKGDTYFVFSGGVGLLTFTSTDLVNWNSPGVVWPNGASWTDPFTGGSNKKLWAPDCKVINGTFHLFYCASTLGSYHSAIFYATSTTGLPGSWTHKGLVLQTQEGNGFNAIDPNLSLPDDGAKWYLSFGSYNDGIKGVYLNPATGMPLSSTYDSLARRTGTTTAEEAPVIVGIAGAWWLFTSWDADNHDYDIRVGKSTSERGPFIGVLGKNMYTENGGTLLLEGDGTRGTGGQDIFVDTDGTIYMIYHGRTDSGNGKLALNTLDFSTGWPVVKY